MTDHDDQHHPGRRVGDRHPLRTLLDSRPFWVGVAFVIICGLLIFTVFTYSREASDRAARKASAQAQYQQCLGEIPLLVKFERFIVGVRSVGNVLLLNSIQMHAITPPGTKVYRQQEKNIRRLRRALERQKGVNVPQVTLNDCRAEHPRG